MFKKFVLAFLLALFLSIFLNFFGLHPFIIYGLIFILLFLFLYLPIFIPAYFLKDEKRIEAFLEKNKKNPQFQIHYGLGTKSDDDVSEAIAKLLSKNSPKHQKALYQVINNLYFQQYEQAKEHVDSIKLEKYKTYYTIVIELEVGSLEKAEAQIEKIDSGWMKVALLAELAHKKGNKEEAILYAKKALQQTRGIQWYHLIKNYKREFHIE